MTRTFTGLALAFATSISIPAVYQAQELPKTPPEKVEVRARYLGVTGWEITDGKTHILIDPYLSRLPGPPAAQKNEFANRSSLRGRLRLKLSVQGDRHVNRCPNGLLLHNTIIPRVP